MCGVFAGVNIRLFRAEKCFCLICSCFQFRRISTGCCALTSMATPSLKQQKGSCLASSPQSGVRFSPICCWIWRTGLSWRRETRTQTGSEVGCLDGYAPAFCFMCGYENTLFSHEKGLKIVQKKPINFKLFTILINPLLNYSIFPLFLTHWFHSHLLPSLRCCFHGLIFMSFPVAFFCSWMQHLLRRCPPLQDEVWVHEAQLWKQDTRIHQGGKIWI